MRRCRPVVSGLNAAVSSGHPLASAATAEVLAAGGNAADAGCAAGLALGVLQPDIVSFSGGAPIMYRAAATKAITTIDGLGHWPRGLPDGYFMDECDGAIPVGVRRTVVPAAPKAWITCLKMFGTMSFEEVAAAALRYARDGFPMYGFLREGIARFEAEYRSWPTSQPVFMPNGQLARDGEVFRQSKLAASIQYMVDEERRAVGDRKAKLDAASAAFYAGDIARAIDKFHTEQGGFLRYADLASYSCRIEPAVTRSWGDTEITVCGPWCQGPSLLQALRILDGCDLEAMGHNSPQYIHTITEALKCAFSDRERFFGDPAHMDVPLDWLLSEEHVRQQRLMIDPARAMPDMPDATPQASRPAMAAPPSEQDTSYVCVVDRQGNVFSATPSDGTNTAPMVPELGMVISTRGSQSRPDPRHRNGAVAGRRPRLTPSPAIAMRGDEIMPFGTPGGDVQPQVMLQFLMNRYVFGMDVQSAIEAPRFATYSFPSSFAPFTHFPGLVRIEDGLVQNVRPALERLGHHVEDWGQWNWLAGGICAIAYNSASHVKSAGADPRRECYALAR